MKLIQTNEINIPYELGNSKVVIQNNGELSLSLEDDDSALHSECHKKCNNEIENKELFEENPHDIKQENTEEENNDQLDFSTVSPIPRFPCSSFPVTSGDIFRRSSSSEKPARRKIFTDYWNKHERGNGLEDDTTLEGKSISILNYVGTISQQFPDSILRRSRLHHNNENISEASAAETAAIVSFPQKNKGLIPSVVQFFTSSDDSSFLSDESSKSSSSIQFEPLVSVLEYSSHEEETLQNNCLWYTEEELCQFRSDALSQIKRCVSKDLCSRRNRAMFTHPALRAMPDDLLVSSTIVLGEEIRKILIVSGNSNTRCIIRRTMNHLFPDARVTILKNSTCALRRLSTLVEREDEKNLYDLILVEERLCTDYKEKIREAFCQEVAGEVTNSFIKSMCGSQLIQQMQFVLEQSETLDLPLFIGISSHINEDGESLSKSGADLLWGKMLPNITYDLRNDILNMLLEKRGRQVVVCG